MKRNGFLLLIYFVSILLIQFWSFSASSATKVLAQQPTDTPLVDGSSTGIFITVITEEPQINVRMGPSSSIYPIVGTLARGETAPALGRSQGGDWIQIEYPGAPNNLGWVYSPLVQVSPGALRIAEPPPTPIPPATPTIDPTLAAQFIVIPTNTRLPTFTPPPSLISPTFEQTRSPDSQNPVPVAIIIIALTVLGIIGFSLSLVLRR